MSAAEVREVEIRFPGPDRDLAGTVVLPAGDGPFPAAVLVGGSGPLDRDSNHRRLRIDVTRQLAATLTGAGIASLRYDRRGVGGSRLLRDGRVEPARAWREAGLHDNAADAAAALVALAGRPDVDAELLFLVGHSEGAVLVAEVAARTLAAGHGPRPAGVVLLAGAAEPGGAVLRWQAAVLPATLPAPVRAVLRQPGPPSLRAYRKEVREPVAPVVLAALTDWVRRQVGGRRSVPDVLSG